MDNWYFWFLQFSAEKKFGPAHWWEKSATKFTLEETDFSTSPPQIWPGEKKLVWNGSLLLNLFLSIR